MNGYIWIRKEKNGPVQTQLHIYDSVFGEYKPERGLPTFQISSEEKNLIFKAGSTTEMHLWLNEILRQKIIIEDSLKNITL